MDMTYTVSSLSHAQAEVCLTLCDPHGCSPPLSLEFSRPSSPLSEKRTAWISRFCPLSISLPGRAIYLCTRGLTVPGTGRRLAKSR